MAALFRCGGDKRDRTADLRAEPDRRQAELLNLIQAVSGTRRKKRAAGRRLSFVVVEISGIEPLTS